MPLRSLAKRSATQKAEDARIYRLVRRALDRAEPYEH